MEYLVVGLGGFLGANARYVVANWMGQRYGLNFPYGTLLINVSGSFVIGVFLGLITERYGLHPYWRLWFSVGFLGAYTTFSTFSYESLALILQGAWGLGVLNIVGSVVLGLGATLGGLVLARWF